jgi:adenine-specific DNA-methyltransferase
MSDLSGNHQPSSINYEVRCTDLMLGLAGLPDGTVDLTVTSPPYNIGKEYEKPRALADYLEWCETWLAEIYRVTKPGGALWLNLGYFAVPDKGRAVPIAYLLWDKSPFYMLQEIVWQYGAGVATKKSFSPRNEKWLWLVKDPDKYTRRKTASSNVIRSAKIPAMSGQSRKLRPARNERRRNARHTLLNFRSRSSNE